MPRHLAVGDIHGCHAALEALLECVSLRDDDVIVMLGDYVNRGPDSHAVIEKLLELSDDYDVICLCGNHELMMLDAYRDPDRFQRFLSVGGDRTVDSYREDGDEDDFPDLIPREHWDFLENQLLPYFENDTHFFVHAGAYADMPLADQPEFMLYWEKWDDPPRHE